MTKDEIFKKTIEQKNKNRSLEILESQEYLKSCYYNKDILNLSNELGSLKIKIAKCELNGKNCDDLKEEKKEKMTQFLIALKANDKDVNKILPNFKCKKCDDKGYLENGNVCECLMNDFKIDLVKEIGINVDSTPTLDEIDFRKSDNKEELYKITNLLLKIYNSKYNTILFTGATGTGKTYIAKSFLKTMAQNLKLCRFYSSFELNRQFLDAHRISEKYNSIMDRLLESDIMVIDDLGSEPIYNNVTAEYFLNLLNERQAKNKITLFTTNLTLNDIKTKYTERFFSRLMDKEISLKFNFIGKDLRLS